MTFARPGAAAVYGDGARPDPVPEHASRRAGGVVFLDMEKAAPLPAWGRAARRALAGAIAGELASGPGASLPEPREIDRREPVAPGHPARPAVDRAISSAWKLAAATRPPRGSAVARRVGPGAARVVAAAGDGWSIVARTAGGPAVLLLDALPAGVADISGEPGLAELIDALTAAAGRAARG